MSLGTEIPAYEIEFSGGQPALVQCWHGSVSLRFNEIILKGFSRTTKKGLRNKLLNLLGHAIVFAFLGGIIAAFGNYIYRWGEPWKTIINLISISITTTAGVMIGSRLQGPETYSIPIRALRRVRYTRTEKVTHQKPGILIHLLYADSIDAKEITVCFRLPRSANAERFLKELALRLPEGFDIATYSTSNIPG